LGSRARVVGLVASAIVAGAFLAGCSGGGGGARKNASFTLQVDAGAATNRVQARAQTIRVLRERLSRTSVSRLELKPQGDDLIAIRLRGVSESEDKTVRRLLVRPGLLEFRAVHAQSEELIGSKGASPGFEPLPVKNPTLASTNQQAYLVSEQPVRGFTGKNIERAWIFRDRATGRSTIGLRFSPPGAALLREVTRDTVGRRLAIVLDREVLATPLIEEEVTVPHFTVPTRLSDRENNEVLNLVQHPLPVRLKIVEEGEQ